MSKKINSVLYTSTCVKYNREKHCHYLDELEDGKLYSHSLFNYQCYPTNIKAEDLPEWFVYGRYYSNFGYLSAKGVKYLKFKPNMWINHLIRDDMLYVSYYKPIVEVESKLFRNSKDVEGYDIVFSGWDVITFLDAVKKYSPRCDTSEVERLLIEKAKAYKVNHPEEHDCENIDEYIAELEEKYKK